MAGVCGRHLACDAWKRMQYACLGAQKGIDRIVLLAFLFFMIFINESLLER
jgi:hypothetical protein